MSTLLCNICEHRARNTAAIVWCPDCSERLCTECLEHHKLSRFTKNHHVIKVEEYETIPEIVREVSQQCPDHGEKFDFVCQTHDHFCCRKCVTTVHSNCTNLLSIDDVISSSMSCDLFEKFEMRLECQMQSLDCGKKDRKANKKLIREQKEKYRTDIKSIRQKIKDFIDQLEEKLMEDLDFTTDLQIKEIDQVIDEIDTKQQAIRKLKGKMNVLKDQPSNLRKVLGLRNLDNKVEKIDADVREILNSNKFDRISVEMSISNDISTFLSKLKCLGTVCVVIKGQKLNYLTLEDCRSCQNVCRIPTEIDHTGFSLQLSTKISAPHGNNDLNVTGCAISSNGQIYIADFSSSKRVFFVSNGGIYNVLTSFIDSPIYDLTCLDSTNIAMSTGSYREIKIVNTATKTVAKKTKTFGNIYGITSGNGNLYFCLGNQNIQSLNLSDETMENIKSGRLKNNSYVCYGEGCIYHTGSDGNSIVCVDTSGNQQWEFRTEKLKHPKGITVDAKKRVFVVGESSNNVIMIHSNGKHFVEVLTERDGLKKPCAICCDRENDIIIICNKNGDLFVYKIK